MNDSSKFALGICLVALGGLATARDLEKPTDRNLLAEIQASGKHTIFVEAISFAKLNYLFEGAQNFTVFAPTDQAVATRGAAFLRSIQANRGSATHFVLSHMMSGATGEGELPELTRLVVRSESRTRLRFESAKGGAIMVNKRPVTLRATARNGVLFEVNGTLAN